MKKTCVRWTKSVRTALIAAAALSTALIVKPIAQTADPSAQPRLAFGDITYVGGFRLPATPANGDSFAFGGRQLTFNPVSNSLFVGTRSGRVAEVSIPSPVNTSNPAAMPFASYLQPFADPTEGHLSQITGEGVALDSLMVYGNRLYGTASVYYDAANTQTVSHYSRSLQLNEPSFQGWSRVWEAGKTGFVAGTMSVVPTEWRSALGGPAATGQCCIPIVARTSWGPSAFAFDPAQVGQSAVTASPLLYYPGEHPTLGIWESSNPTYGATIGMGGMAMIAGTRTVLYFGRNGLGPFCYGSGTSDKTLAGTIGTDGALMCYDPTSTDKAQHAYPYRYQIWAYDLNDFAAVKAGTKQPWEVVPYGVWPFDLPTPEQSVKLGGVGYDAATQTLYISQLLADRDGYSYRPVIHVLRINAAAATQDAGTTTPPVQEQPTSTIEPTTSSVVSAITLSVNRTSPQAAGTAVTFNAFAIGGVQPQEYKWLVDAGTGFTPVTGWSTIDSFTWTPAAVNDKYRVGVWARSSGNTNDAPEASASSAFVIVEPPPVPVTSVTMTANKPAPQTLGASIIFQATAAGGTGPVEFKWLVGDGTTVTPATGWSTSSTFTWTPATASMNSSVRVWARAARVTQDAAQAQAQINFPISAPAPVRLTGVTMTANKPAPQVPGTTITFAAAAVGGAAQYKFLLYDGTPTWKFLTGWTTQNTLTWTPTVENPNYVMRVWVRSATSTKDEWEAETRMSFPIKVPVVKPVGAVTITTNKPAPQLPGTTIIATATASGGSTTLQYKWLINDGRGWIAVTDWGTANTFTWTPSAKASYFIGVWVRNASSTTGAAESTASLPFAIK
jgi:hypothetical protein